MGFRETAAKGMRPDALLDEPVRYPVSPQYRTEYLPSVEELEPRAQLTLDWDDAPAAAYKAPTTVGLVLHISIPMTKLPEMREDNFDRVYAKAEELARDELEALCGADVEDRFHIRWDLQDYDDEIEVIAALSPVMYD